MDNEHVTSTEDESWTIWLKRGAFALAISFFTIFFIYSYARVKQIYDNQIELATLRAEVSELEKRHTSQIEELILRTDAVERVLYGDVVAKLEKHPVGPTKIEIWQRNRDKELRERINAIEKWRMTVEKRIEKMTKEESGK